MGVPHGFFAYGGLGRQRTLLLPYSLGLFTIWMKMAVKRLSMK